MLRFKQPPSFKFLAGTQIAEQIGFSMLQALLVFYLIYQKHMPDEMAYHIVTTFTSLIFVTSLLGGYLSDRYLGQRFSVFAGIILQGAGYLFITINTPTLHISLAFIIVGSALFRPNLSSFLSLFYYNKDTRRFNGFTFMYLASQLGIVIATILAAYIPQRLGWTMVYHSSAAAALIALIILIVGKKHYEKRGTYSGNPPKQLYWIAALAVLWYAVVYFLLGHAMLSLYLLGLTGLAVFTGMIVHAIGSHYERRNRLVMITVLMLSSVVFWAVCYQEYLTINVFISRSVMRDVLGFHVPTVDFLALNALVSVLLCPLISSFWNNLYRKRREPPIILIIALSLLLLTLSMLTLGISTHFLDASQHVNMFWIVAAVILIAVAEFILTPLAISLITLLAPKKITGLMLGVWFMTIGLGWALAGILASQASIPSSMLSSLISVDHVYAHAFIGYAMMTLSCALVLIIARPYLKKYFPVNFH